MYSYREGSVPQTEEEMARMKVQLESEVTRMGGQILELQEQLVSTVQCTQMAGPRLKAQVQCALHYHIIIHCTCASTI